MESDTLSLFYLPTEGVSLMQKIETGFSRRKVSQKKSGQVRIRNEGVILTKEQL